MGHVFARGYRLLRQTVEHGSPARRGQDAAVAHSAKGRRPQDKVRGTVHRGLGSWGEKEPDAVTAGATTAPTTGAAGAANATESRALGAEGVAGGIRAYGLGK